MFVGSVQIISHLDSNPASRVSFDLPRQIGKRKETLRAASRFPIEHAPTTGSEEGRLLSQAKPSLNQPPCQSMLIIKF